MPNNPTTTVGNWKGGVNSMLPPDGIAVSQYAWAINCVNRGGIVQTRPGFDLAASIAGSRLQGAVIFTPQGSRPMMLAAVDGLIYAAKFPFKAFAKLDGLRFRADAPIVTFQRCLKSATVKADQSVELITPIALVIIQDGQTQPGYFDGAAAKHLDPDLGGPPIGLWMAWASSVLWVFSGSRGYASDLASPDTFFATAYIAERSAFEFPAEVTGVVETSDANSLLVFTETTTTALKSNIRDRKQWGATPDFQKVVLPTIGCVAGRSPVNQYGLTWWLSRAGFINLDAAMQSLQTSKLTTVDMRMMRSKRLFSPDLSQAASVHFENYLLLSVPSGGRNNEETWVADQTPSGEAGDGGMSWVGVWTGVRPVVWMRTQYAGRERLFCIAYDATPKDDTHIHVWEAFKDDRRDNDGRITCQFETGMFLAQDLQRFQYAELDLVEILGTVEIDVFVGGMRGPWHKVKSITLQAEIGSIGGDKQKIITAETILRAYKPQTRYIKTEDFTLTGKPSSVEARDNPGIDKGFQLLLEWRGRMGVKAIRFCSKPDPSANRGECSAGEAGRHNIVTEDGDTIR